MEMGIGLRLKESPGLSRLRGGPCPDRTRGLHFPGEGSEGFPRSLLRGLTGPRECRLCRLQCAQGFWSWKALCHRALNPRATHSKASLKGPQGDGTRSAPLILPRGGEGEEQHFRSSQGHSLVCSRPRLGTLGRGVGQKSRALVLYSSNGRKGWLQTCTQRLFTSR